MKIRDYLTTFAIIALIFALGYGIGYYGGSVECIDTVFRGK